MAGSAAVSISSFSQTGGVINKTNTLAINQATGPLTVSDITAGSVTLTTAAQPININGAVSSNSPTGTVTINTSDSGGTAGITGTGLVTANNLTLQPTTYGPIGLAGTPLNTSAIGGGTGTSVFSIGYAGSVYLNHVGKATLSSVGFGNNAFGLTASSDVTVNIGISAGSGALKLASTGGGLSVGTGIVLSGGSVLLNAAGAVSMGSYVTSGAGGIVVVAGTTFSNGYAGTVFQPGTGGRWLVYAPNPGSVTKGTLVPPGYQYNTTYPGTIALPGSGMVYGSPVLVNANFSGTLSSTFGNSPTAVSGYTLSGLDSADTGFAMVGVPSFSNWPVTVSTPAGSYVLQYAGGLSNPLATSPGVGATQSYTVIPRPILPVFANLTGSTSKVYDGTTLAALTPANFSLTGFVNGDSATVTKTTGTYSSKGVGTGLTVTTTLATSDFNPVGGTLLSNYTLPTSASGNIGSIAAAKISVAGAAALSKVYDGSNLASFSGASLSGVMSGDVVTVTTVAGTFNDKNVGVAKPVTVTGVTLAGADAGNYMVNPIAAVSSADITPAKLSVASATAQNKVYDGKTTAGFDGATLSGVIASDVVNVATVTGDFKDKNVGTAKPVTVAGVTLAGADAGNYVLNPITIGSSAEISQRPLSTWTGAAANNLWSDAKNWDAVPDLANVAAVSIPAGASGVVFDASMGDLKFDSINSAIPFTMTGGSLTLKTDFSAPQFTQSNGAINGAGVFTVNGNFNQTGGSVSMGSIKVTQGGGSMTVNSLKAATVSLTGGSISQTPVGGIETSTLTTQSNGGTVLTGSGNKIGTWNAVNSGSGGLQLINNGLINVSAVNNAGDFTIESFGGVVTKGQVQTTGSVSITANSPLTVGVDGIVADGNITLKASNLTSAGNMTLDGPVHSNAGAVVLIAANDLVQNSDVYGAMGVKAEVGGTFTYGPNARSGAQPVSYLVQGAPAGVPGAQLDVPQANLVTTFLDKFELALQSQQDDGPNQDKFKKRQDLVVEGETCRR